MKIVYDPEADALNITFRTGKVKRSIELADEIIMDVDAKSRPLHLEILGAREKLGKHGAEKVTYANLSKA